MAGQGQVPSRQAAVKAGIPMSVPVGQRQQGVPVRAQRDLPRRPDDRRRRGRHRRGRRHGVDDQRAVPRRRRPRRLPLRQRRAARRDHRRRAVVRVRRLPDGPRHRALHRRRASAGRSRTSSPPCRTSGRRRRSRTAASPTRSSPSRSRSARATRSSSSTTRACGRARRPRASAALRPAFDKEGTITAGNASQLSDGASAVVVMSKAGAERRGVTPLGEFVGYGMVAGPDSASLLHQPSRAINAALDRAGLDARRRRPVRDQRGVRRRRAGVDGRPRRSPPTSSTSTAGRSPSATRSA